MAYVRTRLGRWYYEERGQPQRKDDPAIVLLHSFLCDGGMWRGQIEPLSALGRVLVIDGPGHGKSEVPPVFTLEDHADALIDALADLESRRSILVGLSWGGMIGMRAAIHRPDNVAALALLDTSASVEPTANLVKYRLLVSFARRLGVPEGIYRREIAPKMFAPATIAQQPELVEKLFRTLNGYSREGVARSAKAVIIKRRNILESIAAIKAPTLVLCGRDDAATTPDKSEAIAERIKGAKLAFIEGAGHLSALERPNDVNAVLVPFVKSVLAG